MIYQLKGAQEGMQKRDKLKYSLAQWGVINFEG